MRKQNAIYNILSLLFLFFILFLEVKVVEDTEWRNVGGAKKEREIKEPAPAPKVVESKAPSRFGFGGDKGERKPAGEGFAA